MAQEEEKGIFDRLGEILNAPLPGTPQVETRNETSGAPVGQPGQAAPQASEKTPEFDEDELDEAWWKQDWAAFRAHQQKDRNGLDLKQRRDQENFVAYQQQEKQRFDGHQQQWRLNAWKQAVARSPGQKTPPPPWDMPAGAQMIPPMPGPMGGPPPWMRPPGPGHRRS